MKCGRHRTVDASGAQTGDKILTVRMTPNQADLLKDLAALAGVTVGEFIRRRVFSDTPSGTNATTISR